MVKLISHVNGDGDLIEAWMKHYLGLGVDEFHFVVHGSREENATLYAVRDSYPITIEETYEGPFHIEEKRRRLDSVLARCAGHWVLLADSDEFVEFPYDNIRETIHELEPAGVNVMAAPMLQRLTADGSLETPAEIEDPFQQFPLCSVDLYRKMGVKGDIFKFPLFVCTKNTHLAEGGNHHPPQGEELRTTAARGVTHHFKFRRTVSRRLENRINSEHPWRHESVQFRQFLESHENRLPLDGTFTYSRDELFRRQLLRQLPRQEAWPRRTNAVDAHPTPWAEGGLDSSTRDSDAARVPNHPVTSEGAARIAFVVPKTMEFGGLEKHLLALLDGLRASPVSPVVLCLDHETISNYIDKSAFGGSFVRCVPEPHSLREWRALFRQVDPDTIVFCYSWIGAFSWRAPLAAWISGVRRRFSIQHLIPPPPPPPVYGNSPWKMLEKRLGRSARYMLRLNLVGRLSDRTICVCDAIRESLVKDYQFQARKTITIHNGVETTAFVPCECTGAKARLRLGIGAEEFLLVCAARLSEAKGVDILLHAVSRVLRQGIEVKCIILGDGPLREELTREADSLGLTGYVFFEGFQRDIRPYFQAASSFILTSHLEGLPLSILEAMACGQPCIVTNVGGNAEVVKHGVNGMLIAAGSLKEAEEAILFLATHPQERAAMACQARESVVRSFDIKDRMTELQAVLLQ